MDILVHLCVLVNCQCLTQVHFSYILITSFE
jgi:hypothetical protein